MGEGLHPDPSQLLLSHWEPLNGHSGSSNQGQGQPRYISLTFTKQLRQARHFLVLTHLIFIITLWVGAVITTPFYRWGIWSIERLVSGPRSHDQLVMGGQGFKHRPPPPEPTHLTTDPELYPHPDPKRFLVHRNMVGAQRGYDNKPIELRLAQCFPSWLAHATFLRAGHLYYLSLHGTVRETWGRCHGVGRAEWLRTWALESDGHGVNPGALTYQLSGRLYNLWTSSPVRNRRQTPTYRVSLGSSYLVGSSISSSVWLWVSCFISGHLLSLAQWEGCLHVP